MRLGGALLRHSLPQCTFVANQPGCTWPRQAVFSRRLCLF